MTWHRLLQTLVSDKLYTLFLQFWPCHFHRPGLFYSRTIWSFAWVCNPRWLRHALKRGKNHLPIASMSNKYTSPADGAQALVSEIFSEDLKIFTICSIGPSKLCFEKRKHKWFLPLSLCQIANQTRLACRRLLRQCSVARVAQTPFLRGTGTVE